LTRYHNHNSNANYSTWEHLRTVPGLKAYVYHASVGAGEGPTVVKYFNGNYAINGGTTSIMRTVFMTQLMNFGEVETTHLGQFLRGPVAVFALGPQAQVVVGPRNERQE
jgi:hypothetical protein